MILIIQVYADINIEPQNKTKMRFTLWQINPLQTLTSFSSSELTFN